MRSNQKELVVESPHTFVRVQIVGRLWSRLAGWWTGLPDGDQSAVVTFWMFAKHQTPVSYVSSAETPGFNRRRKRVNPASFQSFRVRPITYCRSRSVNGIRVTPENVDR